MIVDPEDAMSLSCPLLQGESVNCANVEYEEMMLVCVVRAGVISCGLAGGFVP